MTESDNIENQPPPPPRNPTAKGYAIETISAAILDGQFAPGAKLGEKELSDWLKVSRTPVREALSALVADGLVVMEPHRGAVVRTITAADVHDEYAVRAALESMAVELAVPNLSPEVVAELEQLVEEMSADIDVGTFLELNRMFHLRIYSFCGSSRLVALIEEAWDRENYFRRQYLSKHGGHDDESDMHDQLMAACRRGDAALAGQLVKNSLLETSETLAAEMSHVSPDATTSNSSITTTGEAPS